MSRHWNFASDGFLIKFVIMKKYIGIVFLLLCFLPLNAQKHGKIDLYGQRLSRLNNTGNILSRNADEYLPMIIKIEHDSAIYEMKQKGVVVFNHRDNLVLACVPQNMIDEISEIQSLSCMCVGDKKRVFMDKARIMSGVDDIHSAIELPEKYDGSGVIVGFSDIGFQPNHINFMNFETGKTRVKKIIDYVDKSAIKTELNTIEEIKNWETDRVDEWHATHVAGILAGGYKENGYHGVATGADIVATTSDLYDACILAGVEDIIAYAKKENRPAVINLSVGSNVGPHDGTELFCQYLEKLGDDAVITISSGNAGRVQQYVNFEFTDNDTIHKTFIYDRYTWTGKVIYGMADFWSKDDREFQVAITIYDRITKSFIYTSPFVGGETEAEECLIATSESGMESDIMSDEFNSCFEGYVYIGSQLNSENNRYNILLSYNLNNKDVAGELGRYCLGIHVKSQPNVIVEGYTDADYSNFTSNSVEGYTRGSTDQSISNIACGENVIVVGASSSRNVAPNINNGTKSWTFNVGEVAFFTGYGTLPDGRTLPHLCAPGNYIVSSVNSTFVETQNNAYVLGNLVQKVNVDGKNYYWMSECGTSMSSPFAAGVFALWLQADPSLTRDEILSIVTETAQKSETDYADPRWGAGNIDAYSGLIKVLENVGIETVDKDKYRLVITPINDKSFSVTVVGEDVIEVSLYSVSGLKCMTFSGCNSIEIDACGLLSGVYVLDVKGAKRKYTERLLIK